MALGIRIDLEDYATPAIGRAKAFLASDTAQQLVGRIAVNAFGVNFDAKNQTPNAIGGTRTNYWSDAKKATSYSVQDNVVTVTVAQVGAALHYYGGTVTPGKSTAYGGGGATKYLTIPATAEAHGKRASDFQGLVVLVGKGGKPFGLGFKEKAGFGAGGPPAPARVIFWLVSKATIPADPTVIPDESALLDPIAKKLDEVIVSEFEGTYQE